ncbi:MAG: dTMP kinase [Peptococcaceae bacterium]|nr:dTMP kinase [Peptococcaceae bacterium]
MGYLINFEGIDLAGKGTQVALLEKNLSARGLKSVTIHFPVLETPIGRIIAGFLNGETTLPPDAVQILYSANRYELREKILSLRSAMEVLILDRYCASGWAYGMALGLEKQWLRNLDAGLPKADLTIWLDLPPGVAAARKRAAGRDVLERDSDFQGRVSAAYRQLAAEDGWAVVEARGEPQDVEQRVLAVVLGMMRSEPVDSGL